jgi:hypothetical protein
VQQVKRKHRLQKTTKTASLNVRRSDLLLPHDNPLAGVVTPRGSEDGEDSADS